MGGARRHLVVQAGGAAAAVALACGLPPLVALLLGRHWPWLFVPLALVPVVFVVLFVAKLVTWLRAPVPFRVPLTTGQQRGLPGLDRRGHTNPASGYEALQRAFFDILLFRPLFRNTPTVPTLAPGLSRGNLRWLWLFAVAFHASLAVVVLRHLRLVLEPVPRFVAWLEEHDVATEMTLPRLHATSLLLLGAVLFLLGRRLVVRRLRYISLAADYFPLLLLVAIATTGVVMRHLVRTDVTTVKELALGLAAGKLVPPARADLWLLVHLFCVAVLLLSYPVGKLMHMPAVLLSPTLILANTSRAQRHINARNPEVELLHYADYENAYRERMLEAGLPVEKR